MAWSIEIWNIYIFFIWDVSLSLVVIASNIGAEVRQILGSEWYNLSCFFFFFSLISIFQPSHPASNFLKGIRPIFISLLLCIKRKSFIFISHITSYAYFFSNSMDPLTALVPQKCQYLQNQDHLLGQPLLLLLQFHQMQYVL